MLKARWPAPKLLKGKLTPSATLKHAWGGGVFTGLLLSQGSDCAVEFMNGPPFEL